MKPWPFPGDDATGRARRLAQAYRARLEVCDPRACAQLDRMAREYGQNWLVADLVTRGPDDELTPAEAAELAATTVGAIRKARARGVLVGIPHAPGIWRYRVRDVLAWIGGGRAKS